MNALLLLGLSLTLGCQEQQRPLELKPLSQAAHGQSAQLLGNRLFLFGGYGPEAFVFDLKRGEWAKFPPMKMRKVFFSSVAVDGRIYAIGGDALGAEPAVIERYDPAKNEWEVLLRSAKLPKSHHTAAAVGEKLYIVGGFPEKEDGISIFDIRSGELSAATPLPGFRTGDHFHYAAALEGGLHVLGGMRFAAGDSGMLNQHWMYNGERWQKRAELPKPSFSKFAAYGVVNGKLHVFNQQDSLHHLYDPKADRWSDALKPMPAPLLLPAVVADSGFLYVLGGVDPSKRSPPGALHVYDAAANRWQTTSDLPPATGAAD